MSDDRSSDDEWFAPVVQAMWHHPGMEQTDQHSAGRLYVVATPIGHLGDLSDRARTILAAVDLIAAEDTRHTGRLLAACGIATPCCSLHEHNEARRAEALVARLLGGATIALVSDAGTPLVSDPGYRLIRAAVAAGVTVSPVPGPSAVLAALSVAGLATDRFVFEGFLPSRRAARRERLQALATEPRTLVFLESCHRLQPALADLADVFGAERGAVLARELTKRHETILRLPLAELCAVVQADPDQRRGECTLVVEGAPAAAPASAIDEDRLLRALLAELPPARAAAVAARVTGGVRRDWYRRALALAAGP